MAVDRKTTRQVDPAFDVVNVRKADGTTKEVKDYSRFLHNSEARVRQDVVVQVGNTLPAAHVVGKLVDGEYVVGTFKGETVVRSVTAVVLDPFDKPVTISLGTTDEPTKYLTAFDGTQARGTVSADNDCVTFIEADINDEIIATIAGTDDGIAGRVAFIFDANKLGVSTLMPST